MTMTPGLVSVTFRRLAPREIIDLCVENGLRAIEWGGDVHVPPGNLKTAENVAVMTAAAGLSVAAYGSYYCLGAENGPDFPFILGTAVALGAPVIRVWAGRTGSAGADASSRAAVVSDALRCADLASRHNIAIAYEFHQGTLTDTTASALELLAATEHPFIKTLWQPPNGAPVDQCLESLRAVLPRLQHLHVFHWWPDAASRQPLSEGWDRWIAYLRELHAHALSPELLLEFVVGDDPAALRGDAETLRELCRETNPGGANAVFPRA